MAPFLFADIFGVISQLLDELACRQRAKGQFADPRWILSESLTVPY